ncbi:MAG TPA: polyphosphate kinase 2 family protein [Pyrinomonadaceae bacterium]|nr:polyphosphate kinase 2 family protein [Chloracidobacterium sp.]MBP9107977.1 polyphosphate kinase 2 family protein [Pyrinomonadaceae bacterium]MBK7801709.1 polyphosphate kinase 2 family protein [Chloracidobacterium sp.]MBL0242018.1 polyphosphate kinase 2 family protein [Chloracidobacterium sp.]HQY66257.1 polyphosphate kinase 2 family protein [Pyrinomonadaceae bacterium]
MAKNKFDIERFRVAEGSKVNLDDHATDQSDGYTDKKMAVADLAANIERLAELQDILYAQNVHSLLIIFQAMDAAGKDGAIKHVMSGLNPQGCQVTSFKQPSSEEIDHDYLWRCQKSLPERGRIGIFNRSHYEEVLVVRVHSGILQLQQLPDKVKNDKFIWQKRFRQIRDWERHLTENGTHVIKFFLHVSKDEQKKRFLERIDITEKNWKFSAGDAKERVFWDDYMNAYEDAMEATSTDHSPWYVIPADKKWFTRLAISEIIVRKLESLDMTYPTMSTEHLAELQQAKKILEGEIAPHLLVKKTVPNKDKDKKTSKPKKSKN